MSESAIPEHANAHVKLWVELERASYAVKKWEVDNAELQRQVIEDGTWVNFPHSCLQRAMGMGLDTPQGRQALGKVISTCESLLARAVDFHGPMPKPGTPSGEVEEWGHDENPEIVLTPGGMAAVRGDEIKHVTPADEGDDGFALEA